MLLLPVAVLLHDDAAAGFVVVVAASRTASADACACQHGISVVYCTGWSVTSYVTCWMVRL